MQRMPETGFTLPTQEELEAWFDVNLPKFIRNAVNIEKDKLQRSLVSKYSAGNRKFNPAIFLNNSSRENIRRIPSIRDDIKKKKFLYAFLGEIFLLKKDNSSVDLSEEVLTGIITELTEKASELALSDRSIPMSLKELEDFCQIHYLAKAAPDKNVLQTVLQFSLDDLVTFNAETVETGMNADITELGNLEKLALYIQLNDAISTRGKAQNYLHDANIFWRALFSTEEHERALALKMLNIFINCAEDEKSCSELVEIIDIETINAQRIKEHVVNIKKLLSLFERVSAFNQNISTMTLADQENHLLEIQHLSRVMRGDFVEISKNEIENPSDKETPKYCRIIGERYYKESLQNLCTIRKKRYFEKPAVEVQESDTAEQNATTSLKQAIAECLGVNDYENKSIEAIISGRFFWGYKKDLVKTVKLFLASEMDELSFSLYLNNVVEKSKTFSIFRPMSWSNKRVKSLENGLTDFSREYEEKQEQVLKSASQTVPASQSVSSHDASQQTTSLAFQGQMDEMEYAVAFSVSKLAREKTSSSAKILELLKTKKVSNKYGDLLKVQAQLAGKVAGYIACLKGKSEAAVDANDSFYSAEGDSSDECYVDALTISDSMNSSNPTLGLSASGETESESDESSAKTSVETNISLPEDLIDQLESEFQKTKIQVETTWDAKQSYSDLVKTLGLLHDANRRLVQAGELQEPLYTAYVTSPAPAA